MLWINGYTNIFLTLTGFSPDCCRFYWANDLSPAGKVLKDWNWEFIDGGGEVYINTAKRFELGYNYAKLNEKRLMRHVVLSGNHFQMVAHGKGVAFAEGIAHFLYSVRGVKTDCAIYLQGTNLKSIPASHEAVKKRIVLKNKPLLKIKTSHNFLCCTTLEITEEKLNNNFLKYTFYSPENSELFKNEVYIIKSKIKTLNISTANRKRQQAVWSAIQFGLQLLQTFENEKNTGYRETVKLHQYSQN